MTRRTKRSAAERAATWAAVIKKRSLGGFAVFDSRGRDVGRIRETAMHGWQYQTRDFNAVSGFATAADAEAALLRRASGV